PPPRTRSALGKAPSRGSWPRRPPRRARLPARRRGERCLVPPGQTASHYVTGPAAPDRHPAGYRIESPIASVVEPLRESLHLLLGIGREEVIDGDVGRRD